MQAGLVLGQTFSVAPGLSFAEEPQPQLVLQTGHGATSEVGAVAVSPNGRILASAGSYENRVAFWDAHDGNLLADIPVTGNVDDLFFDVRGERIAAITTTTALVFKGKGTLPTSGVTVWSVATGKPLKTLATGSKAAAWSPDGKLLAYGVNPPDQSEARIVLAGGEKLEQLASVPAGGKRIYALAFSRNGTRMAIIVSRGFSLGFDLVLFDLPAAREVWRSTAADGSFWVTSVAFSPDDKHILSAGTKRHLKVWDAASGAELRKLSWNGDEPVKSMSFPGGNDTVAVLGNKLRFWKMDDGALIREVPLHYPKSLAFSPLGDWFAVGGPSGELALFDTASTGNPRLNLNGRIRWIASSVASGDGRWLATSGVLDGRTVVWDMRTGARHQILAASGNETGHFSAAFGPGNNWIAVYSARLFPSKDNLMAFWSPASGSRLADHGKDLARGGDTSLISSADGRFVVHLEQRAAVVWDPANKVERRIETGQTKLRGAVIAPDGRTLTTFRDPEKGVTELPGPRPRSFVVKTWEVATGKLLRELVVDDIKDCKQCLASSPDGRILLVYRGNGWSVYDAGTGQKLSELVLPANFEHPGNAAFSRDGKLLAMLFSSSEVSGDGMAQHRRGTLVYSMESGQLLSELSSLLIKDNDTVIGFAGDCCVLTSGMTDVVNIWDWRRRELAGRFMSIAGESASATAFGPGRTSDWLVITADGFFDGSPAAWGALRWQFGQDVSDALPVEAFFNEFYRPGLLAELLGGNRPKPPRQLSSLDRRQPRVTLSAADAPGSAPAARYIDLKIGIEQVPGSPGSGARDMRLFRNGSLVKRWRGDILAGKDGASLAARIPLVDGENRFTAYAFNRDNVKSSDANITVQSKEGTGRRGNAYIVAMGVNKYANSLFDLNFAVPDGRSFSEHLRHGQEGTGSFSRVVQIDLFDREATKGNFLALLRRLAGLPATPAPAATRTFDHIPPLEPEDVLYVFFAGHGLAVEPRFYLIPHDVSYRGKGPAVNQEALKSALPSAISDLELEEILAQMDSRQIVLVIDACNSGQALEEQEKRRGPMNSKGLAQLAYEKGMYVLAAAQSRQAALEFEQLNHGLLTFALVEEGLKTSAADTLPADGKTVIREWLDYAASRVPQLQLELMTSASARGRSVAVVAGEEQIGDPVLRTLQRPRVYYRREPEAQPVVVVKR